MNLQNLRVFLKVAELEHITRASEELNLSQPAVTKIIQGLEHEIHLDLVERQGRRIVLTHAGRVLQTYARQIFSLEREMEEAMESLRDVDAGEITFAANTTAWVYLLPPVVAEFRARYPKVALNIAILNSQDIVEQTLNWSLDFGLVEGDAAMLPEQLKVWRIAYDDLVLVVSPRHRWSKLDLVQPEMLGSEELIVRESGSGIREMIEHTLLHRNVILRPLLVLSDNEAMKQMVINGVGAAILSYFSIRRELANGELVALPIAGLNLRTQVSLVQRTDKQLSRAAQAFCAFLYPLNEGV